MSSFRQAGRMTGEGRMLTGEGDVRRVEFGAVADVSPGIHLSIFRDVEDRKRAEEAERFLDELSAALAATADEDDAVSTIARLAVTRIADWAAADIIEPDGSLRRVIVAHADPGKRELAEALRRGSGGSPSITHPVAAALRTGKPQLVARITDDMLAAAFKNDPAELETYRRLGLVSAMTVPLSARSRMIGAIALASSESHRRYDAADLAVARELARRATVALEHGMFVRDLRLANQSKDVFLRRAEHLQATATELVGAEGVEAIVRLFESDESKSPVEASAWWLYVSDGDVLTLLAATRHVRETAAGWNPIPLSSDNAVSEAARTHAAVWLRDMDDLVTKYPGLRGRLVRNDIQARAAIPLVVGQKVIGVLGVMFDTARTFDTDERAYLTAIANIWAQALHRARLAEAEREAIRRALQAETVATRKKDEFLAMLGHELRNPLSPIVTSLQLMRLRAAPTRAQAVIERQVEHLVRLVDDLLDVSRITQGKIELRKSRVELAAIVLRGLEMASPLLERRRQHVDVEVPAEGFPLDADLERLAQVISNLLTNAAKYSEPGTTVHVAAERDGGICRLRVRDEGVGIPPELLGAVFELFYQQPQSPDRAKGGLGLGLAIVRSLVELHGGRVWALSAGPGAGSEFWVELPLAARADVSAPADRAATALLAAPKPADLNQERRQILVVDDNEDAAQSLSEFLAELGHEVQTAYDAFAALRIVKTFKPQVCLLDIGLPAMDGYDLARKLRQSRDLPPGARLIAITGYGQDADRRRATEAGFAGHLVKPVSFADLSRVLALPPGSWSETV